MKKTLGEVIAETRKQRGMTQLDLAEKMGVTDKAVSKWERNLSCPDICSLPQLSEALGISVDELMQIKEAEKKPKTKIKEITEIALPGVGLAMGVAVAVLTVWGKLDTKSAITMLAIGIVGIAIALLDKDK